MEVLPELGRSVVVEVVAHSRTSLQISYRLNSNVRSVSQHFSLSKSTKSELPMPENCIAEMKAKDKILVLGLGAIGTGASDEL